MALKPETILARRIERLTAAVLSVAAELQAMRRMIQRRSIEATATPLATQELANIEAALHEGA